VLPEGAADFKFENLMCVSCESNTNFIDLTNIDREPPPTITETILAPTLAPTEPHDSNDDPDNFIVHSVINGHKVRLLVDTGATTEYIDEKFAREIGVDVTTCSPRSVRLGNNTISVIDKKVNTTLRCGNDFSAAVSFYVMRQLPVGIDALIGMRFLNMHNIWLHPKTKRMLIFGQNQKQMHVATFHALDTHPLP